MPWVHLTRDERIVVGTLLKEGFSLRKIARHLGRSASTISREIRRNRSLIIGSYDGYRAHLRATSRWTKERFRFRRDDDALMDQVRHKLSDDLSPDQISHLLPIGRTTIYRFVDEHPDYRPHLRTGRRTLRKRYGQATHGTGTIANRTMIDERPTIVNKRERLGDWEGDTYKVKGGWAVALVERKSGYFLSKLMPRRSAELVTDALIELLGALPKTLARTLTLDNGKEFAHHEEVTDMLGVKVYFAEPGRPGQRGTCENTIGLMRQYLPKRGKRFIATTARLTLGVQRLNNRPRKRLGYQTPSDVLFNNRCN